MLNAGRDERHVCEGERVAGVVDLDGEFADSCDNVEDDPSSAAAFILKSITDEKALTTQNNFLIYNSHSCGKYLIFKISIKA